MMVILERRSKGWKCSSSGGDERIEKGRRPQFPLLSQGFDAIIFKAEDIEQLGIG